MTNQNNERIIKTVLSKEEWNKAVIELAYRMLDIKECNKCGYPQTTVYICPFCGNEN